MTESKKINHILYLDGLRGVAALVVCVHHFLVAFYPAMHSGDPKSSHFSLDLNFAEGYFTNTPLNILYGGNFCVCIFFVLSGLVLSYRFMRDRDEEIIIASAVKRYIRLIIPIFCSVMLVFILIKLSLFYNKEAAVFTKSDWWLGSFWNFNPSIKEMLHYTFIDIFLSVNGLYNTTLWTMYYELYGSFLVFGIAIIVTRLRKRYLLYFILCCAFFILKQNYYIAFVTGVFLSDCLVNGKLEILNKPVFAGLILLTALYFGSHPITGYHSIYKVLEVFKVEDPFIFYHIVGAFFTLLLAVSYSPLQKLLSKKSFLFLGRLSFSMYLLHVPIYGSLGCYLFLQLHEHLSYHMTCLIVFAVCFIVLFGSSFLMAKYVDEFSIRFSGKIYSKYFKAEKNLVA
ncbi:MAG: acyltransferase family protein [Cytophagaceae bacterium]